MRHFFDLTPDELTRHVEQVDLPRYVATQLLEWVYRHGEVDPERMTNLARRAREEIGRSLTLLRGTVRAAQHASDGTEKLLLSWRELDAPAGLLPLHAERAPSTECVLIPAGKNRRTACISSQVGCPVGCRFCASGLEGLEGNLSTGQILEQIHHLRSLPPSLKGVQRITNVVFMGMGEPLANFASVVRAVTALNAPWGFGIGARKITISTVGLPAAIRRLAEVPLPITLALSLHAPNDEIRRQLIPWARYASIGELLEACDEYFSRTGREITLEYILIRKINDRIEHARELAERARRLRANVNLIRYNEVSGLPYDRPTSEDVLAFQRVLRDRGVNVHIRASRGRDIAAACGQLRQEAHASSG